MSVGTRPGSYRSGAPGHSEQNRAAPATVRRVDVRIGVTQAPREINVEVADDDRDDIRSRIEAALAGATDVLWITDKRGRDIGIPSAKIAYVELGSAEGDRRIGFGG
jgi:Protein of unknown function (DUF3107)